MYDALLDQLDKCLQYVDQKFVMIVVVDGIRFEEQVIQIAIVAVLHNHIVIIFGLQHINHIDNVWALQIFHYLDFLHELLLVVLLL